MEGLDSPEFPSQVPYDWETRSKYLDLPFPISEYERRLGQIRERMERSKLDSIIVFGNAADYGDVVYLSNFIPFGKAAIIVSREKNREPEIITDAILHGEPINSYAWMTWMRDFRPVKHDPVKFAEAVRNLLFEAGAKRVGIVGMDNFPMNIWARLEIECSDVEWVDFWLDFVSMKSVRSDSEIKLQREIGKITATAMRAAVESISSGRTECEVAGVAYETMLNLGAHDRSFQTIVSSGRRGGLKHSYPTQRRIDRGDLVYLDMGAMKFGYQCDMSRSVVIGGANAEQKEVLDVVLNGYQVLSSMMKPGVKMGEIVLRARELEQEQKDLRARYEGRMYLGLIVHHAIATSFFELPSLGLPDVTLEKNMSFAFEPMAHILDFGTAVIEDTLVITESGVESLTPYELVHW